jgi:hypothetical protein
VRGLAVALTAFALSLPAAAAGTGPHQRVAFLQGGNLVVVDLATGKRSVAMSHVPPGPVHWSGNGKLLSVGGRVAGGPTLTVGELVWAPSGQRAAYATKNGGVRIWTSSGEQTVVPDVWGAQGFAWSRDGSLAIGRAVCHGACGLPSQTSVWVWRDGTLRKVVGETVVARARPLPFAWHNDHILWWSWPNSGSVAADGVQLYEDTHRAGYALMYSDYVALCGSHIAVAAGGDRYATMKKRILFDGRDVTSDPTKSWVSPSCNTRGVLVAAAGRSWEESRFGAEHRSIWQLLPTRRQLTQPPHGWTDENPTLLRNGSILFVRTHQSARKVNGEWYTTSHGKIELLAHGKLREIADATFTSKDATGSWLNYYGHYNWPWRIAVSP